MTKPPTLRDIAAALGVHKSTVSLALSGKGTISVATRQRILAAARELGYEPNPFAQRLASGGDSAACHFCGMVDVGAGSEMILLVQRGLHERSLDVRVYTISAEDSGELQAGEIKQLCLQRPRAVICAADQVDPAVSEALADYQRAGGTVVSYDTSRLHASKQMCLVD